MRNPKRIKKFCNELARYWETYIPDWRFGQFMINFLGHVAQDVDPFFPEDDDMLKRLSEFFNHEEKNDDEE